ncbi:AvrBs1/Avra family type III secretion system effector [Xylophilus ampelinus]|uniref:Type III secretion AvrA family effector n=1 Tax=Xylophilus ampelinus TaxID=54067 RepID=A0A318SLY4_9BURK|nr:AvrBs1/Avra family type III secretion system effector [Xylophilus ampelinus]MCS4510212.1 avirulence protein AvrBs1 [Xylophilus ampelinus]PYE78169.1 type III secretion AvrA family effector [Xylophilus ampelinus]
MDINHIEFAGMNFYRHDQEQKTQQNREAVISPSMSTIDRLPPKNTVRPIERGENNIKSLQTSALQRIQEKKIIVQNLAKLQSNITKFSDSLELENFINNSFAKEVLPKENSAICEDYNHGKPMMIRSLRFSDPEEAAGGLGMKGKTPAKREVDTACNKSTAHDIVMIPASVISTQVKLNLISEIPRKGDKEKYKDLPSVIYRANGSGKRPSSLQARNGFGDLHSFKSNNGFNSDYEKNCRMLSHAEKMKLIESNLVPFIRPDPDRSSLDFIHSVDELVEAQSLLQAKRPGSSLRHNEYCTKLELWDAKAIAIGKSRPLAVATLIEFNLEMLSIAEEIDHEGHENKMVSDFIERQLSWLSPTAALDKKSTLEKLSKLTAQEKSPSQMKFASHFDRAFRSALMKEVKQEVIFEK